MRAFTGGAVADRATVRFGVRQLEYLRNPGPASWIYDTCRGRRTEGVVLSPFSFSLRTLRSAEAPMIRHRCSSVFFSSVPFSSVQFHVVIEYFSVLHCSVFIHSLFSFSHWSVSLFIVHNNHVAERSFLIFRP